MTEEYEARMMLARISRTIEMRPSVITSSVMGSRQEAVLRAAFFVVMVG
jgi:hypothetical protein